MFCWKVTLCNGEEAGQAALGSQKVVASFVQLLAVSAIADREQATILAIKEGEVH
ncbi:hypothetical protein D3C80_2139350 [compost metagenome]